MPRQRGVNAFWLDISALESDRSHFVGTYGAKQGTLMFGAWVRLFTWQYQHAVPISGAEHVARLTGMHIHTARLLWHSLCHSLPHSLVQREGGWYCKRTSRVLDNYNKKQQDSGATDAPLKVPHSDLDSDLDLSSLDPSQNLRSGDPSNCRSVKAHSGNEPSVDKSRAGRKNVTYSLGFEELWQARPKRAGGDPKQRARKAWNARLADHDPATMIDGMRRYARYCEITGKAGSEYVKQTATFLGPDEHFLEPWDPPTNDGKTKGPSKEALMAALAECDPPEGFTINGECESDT